MLSPEAYSNDPEVFTRTLLTQELDDFSNKVYRKPNLEQLDYEEALSRFEALTKIGFMGKYVDKLEAELVDDGKDSNSEARAQYSVELNVKGNVTRIVTRFLQNVCDHHAPDWFVDRLCTVLDNYLNSDHPDNTLLLSQFMMARVYPRSLEMHKRLLKSILKQSDGYYIYFDYIKNINIRNKGESYIKLTLEEIVEVADEMRACGKEMKYIEELIGQLKKV